MKQLKAKIRFVLKNVIDLEHLFDDEFPGQPPGEDLRVNDLAWEEKIFLIAKHTYVFRVLFDPNTFTLIYF